MKPKEVIEALKMCGTLDFEYCNKCPYNRVDPGCGDRLMLDAAELLEKAYREEEQA